MWRTTRLAAITCVSSAMLTLAACALTEPTQQTQDKQRPPPLVERADEPPPTAELFEWADVAALGDAASRGKSVFDGQGQCVSCHTLFGEGAGTAPELSSIGFILSSQAKQAKATIASSLDRMLAAHPNAAAVRAPMSDQEVASLAAFLFTLRNPPANQGEARLATAVAVAAPPPAPGQSAAP